MHQTARHESRYSRQSIFFTVRQALRQYIYIIGTGGNGERGRCDYEGVKDFVVQISGVRGKVTVLFAILAKNTSNHETILPSDHFISCFSLLDLGFLQLEGFKIE